MKNAHNLHDILNSLIHALSRPWAFIPMVLFVLIPSAKVSSALESGADFLRIGSDARASSMGGAYTAAANDVSAIHYNPAGLAAVNGTELGLSHAKWLLDGSYNFVGLAMPLKSKNGLVMGLGNGAGFNAGVGIMLMDARLDYAVTPFGELGSAQRISLKKKF